MKNSLFVVSMFALGCWLGIQGWLPENLQRYPVSTAVLYILMFQVGLSVGSNKDMKTLFRNFQPQTLLIPLSTVLGTLVFSALASLLLSRWSVFDCMAVGSGFAYYSLSSVLIMQFKEPSLGLQMATELGTIALLANVFREMIALLGAPVFLRYFGKLAPISAAGVGSVDVMLPSVSRYLGKDMVPISILHGILIDLSVPFFVSFFCRF